MRKSEKPESPMNDDKTNRFDDRLANAETRQNGKHRDPLTALGDAVIAVTPARRTRWPHRAYFRWFSRQSWREAPLQMSNQVLLVLAIGMTLASPLFIWREAITLHKLTCAVEPNHVAKVANTETIPPAHSGLSEATSRRRYFRTREIETSPVAAAPLSAAEVPGLAERYSLVGIIMGDSPQAIVRDNAANTSMFLGKGQQFGGYLVEEIQPDRIVLALGTEHITLTM